MKKLLLIVTAIIATTCTMAQAPEKMSYQAIIRNAANNLVVNQTVGIRISILQGSAAGTAVYVETQTPATNINGLVSIDVGSGSVVSGTFSTIDWSSGPYYIKTETDPAGGTSYSITGTSQLLSVPYALYAKSAGSASVAAGSITNTQISSSAAIAYSKLNLTNSVVNADITANAVTTSKVADGTVTSAKIFDGTIVNADINASAAIALSKINITGTGSSSNFLRGDGSWSVPTAAQGIVVYTGTTGGAISQTISDLNIRTVIVAFNGGSGAASSITLTIPSAASYPAGTMISISVTSYITANPSWSLISPSSNYSALNFNASSMASGVSVGATNGFRIVSDGVSNWYRVLGQ